MAQPGSGDSYPDILGAGKESPANVSTPRCGRLIRDTMAKLLLTQQKRGPATPCGAYPRPRTVASAAETCNKFLKIEHHDSIVYSKHELTLTFLAGATSDLTAGNTTQERLDLPTRFLQQILLLPYFTM